MMFGFDPIAFWIVVTGVLVNCTGALLGNYLVLRRMSLLGDAISHAVLPGLAIAFVVTQTRSPLPMLIGALAAGVATIVLTELIHTRVKVPEDSAMGVVFTTLFAIGVVIISKVAAQVDLDPGCVLYGILETAALDTVDIGALEIPRITITMFAAFSAVVAFILLLWKELKIVAFDPALATTLGIPARLVHYALMMMVAGFCVAAFEAVGSILVVAMLIVPPAAAYLCTDRLSFMVVISAVIAAASAFFGRLAAFHLGTSVAAMMAVAAGGFFVLAFFAAPRHGLAARAWYKMRVGMR
ncbi:metal ABC transporter permease, partial [bacterium]|nr:metal ABC transporter permease [bacterium]